MTVLMEHSRFLILSLKCWIKVILINLDFKEYLNGGLKNSRVMEKRRQLSFQE